MRISDVLKASLLAVIVLLCVGVPIVNSEDVVSLEWTSPTGASLSSFHMVSADDGWAMGASGTIIRWAGTEWIPEFPSAILMLLLTSLMFVVVIMAKTALKKHRKLF